MKKCRAVSDYKREKRFGPPVKPLTLSADMALNYRFEACRFCRFVPPKRHPFTFVPFQSFCLFLSLFCLYSYIKTLNQLHVYKVPYIKIKTKTKKKKKCCLHLFTKLWIVYRMKSQIEVDHFGKYI